MNLLNFFYLINIKKSKKSDWSFQDDAVNYVLKDFKKNNISRNLLVIPTGGGKTVAAIRIINRMVNSKFLDKDKRAIWIVHTKALKDQAEEERDKEENKIKFKFNQELSGILEIKMKAEALNIINSSHGVKYKLIIIDEAHHSAAKTYREFFEKKIGILGLTATPTRSDNVELNFDKISYSITFAELERRGVILNPKFITSKTNFNINATSLSYPEDINELNKFNFKERNNLIAEVILKNRKKFKKVIVFAGTNNHAKLIYEAIRIQNKIKGSPFEHIGYIFGNNDNEKNIKNKEYLKEHKKYKTSILVNCHLLNEGYDDSSIDTVVMATPTSSILYYMQCVGRVVRSSSDNNISKAFVIEIVDRLPNIRYRIDNRWLYADISDFLEPEIIDKKVFNYVEFRKEVINIFKKYKVKEEYYRFIPENENFQGNSFLLFHGSPDENSHWRPLFITNKNSNKYVSLFNEISNNIEKYQKIDTDFLLFNRLNVSKDDQYFSIRDFKIGFIESLKRAYRRKSLNKKVDCLIYVTFNKIELNIFQKIIYFIKKIINRILLNNK